MIKRGFDERGATAVEYALLIACVVALLVFAFIGIGGGMENAFNNTVGGIDD